MEKRFIGEKLVEALQYRGIRMSALAKMTGLSKQSISSYCSETTEPSYSSIFKIAMALNFPIDYFISENSIDIRTENTYFRSQAAATKMAQQSQKIKMEYACRLYTTLLRYVNLPVLDLPEIIFDGYEAPEDADSPRAFEEIERIAMAVRKEWGLGSEPIENLQFVLEKHGIVVTGFKNVEGKIDAFCQKMFADNELRFLIALAIGDKPIGRLRFDMGHELGHILLHYSENSNDSFSKEELSVQERQANMFSGAFLLPKDAFYNDFAAYSTQIEYYVEMKKKWGVSIQAMVYRAHQLGMITWNQYSYLMRQISKRGWRTREPGDVPGRLNSTIFQASIDMLFEGEYLTPYDLKKEFARNNIWLNEDDLEDLMGLRAGTLASNSLDNKMEPGSKILKFHVRDKDN